MRGEVRRGYFVQGLSGMQFGLPEALDHLRDLQKPRAQRPRVYAVNGIDPANPHGPGIPFPFGDGSMQRTPGTYVVFRNGTPQLLIQNLGSRIWIREGLDSSTLLEGILHLVGLTRLPGDLRPVKHIDVEFINGSRAALDPACEVLQGLGFVKGPNQTLRYESYR